MSADLPPMPEPRTFGVGVLGCQVRSKAAVIVANPHRDSIAWEANHYPVLAEFVELYDADQMRAYAIEAIRALKGTP